MIRASILWYARLLLLVAICGFQETSSYVTNRQFIPKSFAVYRQPPICCRSTRLHEKQDDSEASSSPSLKTRFLRVFFSKDKKTEPPDDDINGSSNLISSFWRKRREDKKRDQTQEMLDKLADESPADSSMDFLKAFNTTNLIASVFSQGDQDVSRVRKELNNVGKSKEGKSLDEMKIEEVRQRRQAAGERVEAQRVADQRSIDRFTQQRRLEASKDTRAKMRKEETEKASENNRVVVIPDVANDDTKTKKRGGVINAAQKFLLNAWQSDDQEWIVVCPKTRISPGEILPVAAAGLDLLLVASKDGSSLHCIANSCPHLGTPLEVGTLERRPIESGPSPLPVTYDVAIGNEEVTFQETDIANMLTSDGCEDCIVCPLHKTAFALESGDVRGEWCPYPPVLGKITGKVKPQTTLPVFDVRARGKSIEVRLNSPVESDDKTRRKK